MHILRIEHQVPDFEAWKAAFDGDPIGRERSGVRRYRILRATDDPSYVMIDLEFDSASEAEAAHAALRGLWERVNVMHNPQARGSLRRWRAGLLTPEIGRRVSGGAMQKEKAAGFEALRGSRHINLTTFRKDGSSVRRRRSGSRRLGGDFTPIRGVTRARSNASAMTVGLSWARATSEAGCLVRRRSASYACCRREKARLPRALSTASTGYTNGSLSPYRG